MSDSSTSVGRNKRTANRHEWSNCVQVAWVGEPYQGDINPITLEARDISVGGLSIRSRAMMHPGQFGIILLGRGKNDILVRGVEVRFCRYDKERREHIIGCCWSSIPKQINLEVLEHDDGLTMNISIINPELLHAQLSDTHHHKKSA